ncbi:PREDICTED: uncharacterized protein LOC109234638 [Nicotiana attenuata]|uniref:uncharacterized protein LOC109234638 n=1 Tax=Nicotiana attenuata TaxID=49451 RepID=UPI000905AADA|nr:PREDICTED: uncharacterized protein LOC109234638 [Nicotiana attenuata]
MKKPFRFLNFWVEHASFKELVKENWKADFSANPYIIFNHKMKKLKKALSVWSKETFGDIFQKVASLEEVVLVHEAEFEANPTKLNRQRLQKVQAVLIKFLALEEKYWKQKAGMAWFKDGDRNTKFFHAHVRGRRKKLQLNRIQNRQGVWIEEEERNSCRSNQDNVPTLIDMGQNEELIKQPTMEEVRAAVFGLNGDGAGGPDGFTGKFYQSCWEIIGDDLFDMVRAFFNGHDLPKCVTHTNLVLIPKKKESGFVKGRSIVENILLTQQIVTDMRLRTKVGPNVIMKLDMTKAYDRLSWLFLTKVLRKMGFSERFIGMVFAEALSRGLNALHLNLYFCGYGLPKWSPKINHLSYADDMIIFSSSDATSLRLIMEVLAHYESASGQLVNKAKSAVYLHHLTNIEVANKVEMITGIKSYRASLPLDGSQEHPALCPVLGFETAREMPNSAKSEDLSAQVVEIGPDGQFHEATIRQIWSERQYLAANTCVRDRSKGEFHQGTMLGIEGKLRLGGRPKDPTFRNLSSHHKNSGLG